MNEKKSRQITSEAFLSLIPDAPYTAVTRGIAVHVEPEFQEYLSRPEEGHFVWAYHVTIENTGAEIVKLTRRYWKIVDATGCIIEVEGEGVIGQSPVLEPGTSFSYSSGTPLQTSSGMMFGHYTMQDAKGRNFVVNIPGFSLDSFLDSSSMH